MTQGNEKLVKLLIEAHTNELAIAAVLGAHVRLARHPSYRSLLQTHLDETREHAERVRDRLQQLGYKDDRKLQAFGLAQGGAKQAMAMAKAPVDILRGGRDTAEKMLKNAIDEVMTEGMEIAAYDAIEAVAKEVGDVQTAELARSIREDEERMLDSLRAEIPALAGAFAGG